MIIKEILNLHKALVMDRVLRPLYLFGAITNKDLHYFQLQRPDGKKARETNSSKKAIKPTQFSINSPFKRN